MILVDILDVTMVSMNFKVNDLSPFLSRETTFVTSCLL